MAEIPVDRSQPITLRPTGTVAPTGFQAQERAGAELSQLGGSLMQQATAGLNRKAQQKGALEGAKYGAQFDATGKLIPLSDLPVDPDTIYGASFQASAIDAYTRSVSVDARSRAKRLLAEHPADPASVKDKMGRYVRDTLGGLEGNVRALVEDELYAVAQEAETGAVQAAFALEREQNRDVILEDISEREDALAQTLQTTGDSTDPLAVKNRQRIIDGYQSLADGGYIGKDRADQYKTDLDERIYAWGTLGNLRTRLAAVDQNPRAMAGLYSDVEAFRKDPVEMDEEVRNSVANQMEAEINQKISRYNQVFSIGEQEKNTYTNDVVANLVLSIQAGEPVNTTLADVATDNMLTASGKAQIARLLGANHTSMRTAYRERKEAEINIQIERFNDGSSAMFPFTNMQLEIMYQRGDIGDGVFKAARSLTATAYKDATMAELTEGMLAFDIRPADLRDKLSDPAYLRKIGMTEAAGLEKVNAYEAKWHKEMNDRQIEGQIEASMANGTPLTKEQADLWYSDIHAMTVDIMTDEGRESAIRMMHAAQNLPSSVTQQIDAGLRSSDPETVTTSATVLMEVLGARNGYVALTEHFGKDKLGELIGLSTAIQNSHEDATEVAGRYLTERRNGGNGSRRLKELGDDDEAIDEKITEEVEQAFRDRESNFFSFIGTILPGSTNATKYWDSMPDRVRSNLIETTRKLYAQGTFDDLEHAAAYAVEHNTRSWSIEETDEGPQWKEYGALKETQKALINAGNTDAAAVVTNEHIHAAVRNTILQTGLLDDVKEFTDETYSTEFRLIPNRGSVTDPKGVRYFVEWRADDEKPWRKINGFQWRADPQKYDFLQKEAVKQMRDEPGISKFWTVFYPENIDVRRTKVHLDRLLDAEVRSHSVRGTIDEIRDFANMIGLDTPEPPHVDYETALLTQPSAMEETNVPFSVDRRYLRALVQAVQAHIWFSKAHVRDPDAPVTGAPD